MTGAAQHDRAKFTVTKIPHSDADDLAQALNAGESEGYASSELVPLANGDLLVIFEDQGAPRAPKPQRKPKAKAAAHV